MAELYTCVRSFIWRDAEYHIGEVVSADDPGRKHVPDAFEPVHVREIPGKVEQATAAPGEKRKGR